MKLDVPFYNQEVGDYDCVPISLKMVLEYLSNNKYDLNEIKKRCMQTKKGLTWTIGAAVAAKELGFNSKFITLNAQQHQEKDIEYYKEFTVKEDYNLIRELFDKAKNLSIPIEEKDMNLEELLSYLSESSVPLILINWNVLANKEGYLGHAMPIVGYDKDYIYLHQPGPRNPEPYFKIKKDLFFKAWESEGTDKDVVIVQK